MNNRKSLVSLVAALALVTGALVLAQEKKEPEKKEGDARVIKKDSGLIIKVVAEAKDTGTQKGDVIWVHYTGKLESGEKFDSSLDRGQPFKFVLGDGQVIKGWDEGLLEMKIGEKRQLTIPAALGYGAAGSPPKIPGGATLIFDVQLIGIARPDQK